MHISGISNKKARLPKKHTILVADDDPYILDCLSLILQDAGYHVETLQNGKVLQVLTHFRPDLVLLDLWMSGVNGKEICLRLKNTTGLKNIPVIMISANSDIARIAAACGADDFLMKPFDMLALLTKVEAHLSGGRNTGLLAGKRSL